MKKIIMTALALTMALGSVAPAMAANARHPNRNVDRRVDKGGPTGDDQVDKLNQQQLDAARAGNGTPMGTMPMGKMPMGTMPMGAPVYQPGMPARPMGQ